MDDSDEKDCVVERSEDHLVAKNEDVAAMKGLNDEGATL